MPQIPNTPVLTTGLNNEFDMEAMKIKFGGPENQIDANTFINSLIHFTNVVQEVNKGLNKDKKVEVKIVANTKGSFIVNLMIESSNIIDGIRHIFNSENVTYAAGLIYVVGEVYKVAKHLKGKKPKEITNDRDATIKIENNDGEVKVFDFRGANIYLNSPVVITAIEKEFETLEADDKVTSVEFLDKDEKPIVEIDKDEFYNLSSTGATLEITQGEKIETVKTKLNISLLDLDFKKKWEFYYLGNKISAKINDGGEFSERINKGESFAKGDTLEVEMEIKKVFDEGVNAYVNKGYTIIKIVQHFKRPPQGNLDLLK